MAYFSVLALTSGYSAQGVLDAIRIDSRVKFGLDFPEGESSALDFKSLQDLAMNYSKLADYIALLRENSTFREEANFKALGLFEEMRKLNSEAGLVALYEKASEYAKREQKNTFTETSLPKEEKAPEGFEEHLTGGS